MSDVPTSGGSSDSSATGASEPRLADPSTGQVQLAAEHVEPGRWKRWKARANRILPRRPPEPEDRLRSPLPGVVLFICLLAVAAASLLLPSPPAPLPANAAADQYSAERALAHIEALATGPRAPGTSVHADAQAYLLAQLKQLGLEPQVQEAEAVRDQGAAHVENVLVRLPGSGSGRKAVLLMAHYDSVPTGPGAADDASGCATLLETARALTADNQTLANDVIFLFSDGEEVGQLGARAFVRQHPWAKDVGLVLNFDPEGLTGRPLTISDVSPNDGWLISQYAEAAKDSLASSIDPDVYRLLPTASDLNAFKDAGYPGFEFGGGGGAAYHTVLDHPANVSLDSLQDQGSHALSLVRHFGELELTVAHRGDAEYFTVPGTDRVVHYPQSWNLPFVALAGLVWIGALVFGRRWQQVSIRGVLLGLLASLLVVGVLAGVGALLWRLLVAVYPQYGTWGGDTYNGAYYWAGFMALGVGLGALLLIGFRTRIRTAELALGALLSWLALAVGLSAWLPGAAYLPTWMLAFGSIGLWGWFALRRRGSTMPWRIGWLALSAVPVIVLAAPLLYEGYKGLNMQLAWVLMAVLGLLIGLLAPHLAIIARPSRWWLPALMGAVAAVFLVAGHATSAYSSERPLQDTVLYGMNADQGKAYWIGLGGLDAWTTQFFGEDGSGGDVSDIWPDTKVAYKATAPLADLTPPDVAERGLSTPGVFHLRVVPAPGTWHLFLYVLPTPTSVTYYVQGKPIKSEYGWLGYTAPPAEGFDLTVKASGLDSLRLRVAAETLGLPTVSGFTYAARPAWIIPSADYYFSDSTWVAKTFTFGKEQAQGADVGSLTSD